jgi:hypothetical protein
MPVFGPSASVRRDASVLERACFERGGYVGGVTRARLAFLAFLFGAAVACSKLPDYAAPQASMSQRSEIDLSDVIGYRPLTRDDFKGPKAPLASAEDSKKLGAQLLANILPPAEMEILVRWTEREKGDATYEARLKQAPRYTAVMNRKYSWWNPRSTNPEDYQLQHEQIHFALAEISARRLNAAGPELLQKIQATGSSAEAVQEDVKQQVNQVLRDETARLTERNHAFDLDTSVAMNPKKQAEWLRIAESELEALAEHAVPFAPAP